MHADGACRTVPNPEVRMTFNWTVGRRKPADKAPHQNAAPVAKAPFRPTVAGDSDA
jgi:hypothetical protein